MTLPPPAMVALISESSSSSPRIASCKCLGVIRFTFKSFDAFPANSRTCQKSSLDGLTNVFIIWLFKIPILVGLRTSPKLWSVLSISGMVSGCCLSQGNWFTLQRIFAFQFPNAYRIIKITNNQVVFYSVSTATMYCYTQ